VLKFLSSLPPPPSYEIVLEIFQPLLRLPMTLLIFELSPTSGAHRVSHHKAPLSQSFFSPGTQFSVSTDLPSDDFWRARVGRSTMAELRAGFRPSHTPPIPTSLQVIDACWPLRRGSAGFFRKKFEVSPFAQSPLASRSQFAYCISWEVRPFFSAILRVEAPRGL